MYLHEARDLKGNAAVSSPMGHYLWELSDLAVKDAFSLWGAHIKRSMQEGTKTLNPEPSSALSQ